MPNQCSTLYFSIENKNKQKKNQNKKKNLHDTNIHLKATNIIDANPKTKQ